MKGLPVYCAVCLVCCALDSEAFRLERDAEALHQGTGSTSRRTPGCTLVAHVPKTGGTTLRRILGTLSVMQKKSLLVCYPTNDCKSKADLRSATEIKANVSMTAFDGQCKNNDLVFGHGVTMGFAKKWHINGPIRKVAMIRNPVGLVASHFQHRTRLEGDMPSSFDEYIHQGHARHTADGYMKWFVRNYTTADREDPASLLRKLQYGWSSNSDHLLLLTENYLGSIEELGDFLGASPEEKQALEDLEQGHQYNPGGNYLLTVHKAAWNQLLTDIMPIQMVYNLAVENAAKRGKKGHTPPSETVSVEMDGDVVKLTIPREDDDDASNEAGD